MAALFATLRSKFLSLCARVPFIVIVIVIITVFRGDAYERYIFIFIYSGDFPSYSYLPTYLYLPTLLTNFIRCSTF